MATRQRKTANLPLRKEETIVEEVSLTDERLNAIIQEVERLDLDLRNVSATNSAQIVLGDSLARRVHDAEIKADQAAFLAAELYRDSRTPRLIVGKFRPSLTKITFGLATTIGFGCFAGLITTFVQPEYRWSGFLMGTGIGGAIFAVNVVENDRRDRAEAIATELEEMKLF